MESYHSLYEGHHAVFPCSELDVDWRVKIHYMKDTLQYFLADIQTYQYILRLFRLTLCFIQDISFNELDVDWRVTIHVTRSM